MPGQPHPFTLRQLQYVVAVADLLSFRKAAERCNVSQPSLSSQIAEAEKQLGVVLFERDRRRVLVTAAGAPVIERARRLLADADDLALAARQSADPFTGTWRIGVIPTVSPYLLPAIAPALRARYPRLSVRWIEDRTDALRRELEAGTLDAMLLALEAPLGAVDSAVIAQDPFVLVTPPGHPLGERSEPAEAAELRGANVLLLDDGHCFRDQALAFCSQAKTRELEFRATSLTTLTQMVAGGIGVTLLPRLAVPSEVRRSEVLVREFAKPAPYRTLALCWRRQSPLAEALRAFAGTIRSSYPPASGKPGVVRRRLRAARPKRKERR